MLTALMLTALSSFAHATSFFLSFFLSLKNWFILQKEWCFAFFEFVQCNEYVRAVLLVETIK